MQLFIILYVLKASVDFKKSKVSVRSSSIIQGSMAVHVNTFLSPDCSVRGCQNDMLLIAATNEHRLSEKISVSASLHVYLF